MTGRWNASGNGGCQLPRLLCVLQKHWPNHTTSTLPAIAHSHTHSTLFNNPLAGFSFLFFFFVKRVQRSLIINFLPSYIFPLCTGPSYPCPYCVSRVRPWQFVFPCALLNPTPFLSEDYHSHQVSNGQQLIRSNHRTHPWPGDLGSARLTIRISCFFLFDSKHLPPRPLTTISATAENYFEFSDVQWDRGVRTPIWPPYTLKVH